jgi:hypothetical protein
MPTTNLDISDAVELAELLQFLQDWLATDRAQLGESLNGFVGSRAYDLDTLRADLTKFTFLLGASDADGDGDGDGLFDPEPE